MGEIRWTEESLRWLRNIHDYIASENPEAARKVIAGIYEKAQTLRRFPGLGSTYRDEKEGRICILLYGHYRIAYLLRNDGRIDILGVFHDALDIERYLP
jgi:plasmid stabilization system protein ParE